MLPGSLEKGAEAECPVSSSSSLVANAMAAGALSGGACCARQSAVFVGSPGVSLRQCFGTAAADNYVAWFQGANATYVHAARTAIHRAVSLLQLRPGDEVLVPAYNCGSEVDALLHAGAQVCLFRISREAEIDIDDLAGRITRATRALYIIHYFGFAQRLEPVINLCRERGLFLIEDCALSALTEVEGRRIGSSGDIAVYNFPKVLPVPDGGALVINNPILRNEPWDLRRPRVRMVVPSTLRLLRLSLLRHLPQGGLRALACLRARRSKSPARADESPPAMPRSYYYRDGMSDRRISRLSERVMRRTNLAEVRRRRRENFSALLGSLGKAAGARPLYGELAAGTCPLVFPILAERAGELASRLRALAIPAFSWWSGYHQGALDWSGFPEACYLKDHVVAVPIHQGLSTEEVSFIGRAVAGCAAAASRVTDKHG